MGEDIRNILAAILILALGLMFLSEREGGQEPYNRNNSTWQDELRFEQRQDFNRIDESLEPLREREARKWKHHNNRAYSNQKLNEIPYYEYRSPID